MWDLRTFKLAHSVPSLDLTSLVFNAAGDVAFARLRQRPEDLDVLHRRRRHPLHMAFRTLDASDWTDIADVDVERCVLDVALDATDGYLAAVTLGGVGGAESMDSGLKLFEVRRQLRRWGASVGGVEVR